MDTPTPTPAASLTGGSTAKIWIRSCGVEAAVEAAVAPPLAPLALAAPAAPAAVAAVAGSIAMLVVSMVESITPTWELLMVGGWCIEHGGI
jgi:hypothetical protein